MAVKDETIDQVSQELATYRLKLSSVQKEHHLRSSQLTGLKSDIEQALEKLKDNSIMEPTASASECISSSTDYSEDSTENDSGETGPSTMESEIHILDKVEESKNNFSVIVNQVSLEKELLTSEQVPNKSDSNINMESEITESNPNVTYKLTNPLHDTSLSTNMESENTEESPNVPNQPTEPSHDGTHNTNIESESSLNVPNQSTEATQDASFSNNIESENDESGQNVPNEPTDTDHDTSHSTYIESDDFESRQNVLNEPSDPSQDTSYSTYIESDNFESSQNDLNEPSDPSQDAYLSTHIKPENAKPNENGANQPTESFNFLSLSNTESPAVEVSEMISTEEEVANEESSIETDSKTNEDEPIPQSENEIPDISDDEMEPMSSWERNAQDQLDPELGLPEFHPIGQTKLELVSNKDEAPLGLVESDVTAETKDNALEDLNEKELGIDVKIPENEGQNLSWMLD